MSQFPVILGPGNTLISSSAATVWFAVDNTKVVTYITSSQALPNSINGYSTMNYAVNATAGAVNLSLPASVNGTCFRIKKIDSSANTVNIYPSISGSIDNLTTQSLSTQWSKITILAYSSSLWLTY